MTSTLDFCASSCGISHTHTHPCTVTEQEQQLMVEVGWQGEERSFTALTKIKHEDFVVHSAVGKTNIIFFTSERGLGTHCIKGLND